ncbi:glucuronosyltransferase [Neorhizobium sp. LMR1-1-1.1]
MILLTVGTQLPFDRLVQIMDAIAPQLSEKIFAQIGQGEYVPRNFEYCRMALPEELAEKFGNASRVVSHAGTGSVLTARRYGKPIILFPRRASLGEHRNEHQLATCQQLNGAPGLSVAYDETELRALLNGDAAPAAAEPTLSGAGSKLGRGIADYIRRIDPDK